MVMAMTPMARPVRLERLVDASVATSAIEIAGARHEVLPPRRIADGEPGLRPALRAAPP